MWKDKYIIYYREASLPDQAFFKRSPHTNSISNSAILCNNYISLLSDFVCMRTREEKMASQALDFSLNC